MLTIYYVEDDENISRSVKEFLEQRDCKVSIFSTIAAAKCALERMCPALLLIDWNMPDGNGNTLCQWVRSNLKELPVIFLTVRGDSQDIVFGFQNGADDYVVKPFELDVLFSRICALLRRTGDVESIWDINGNYVNDNTLTVAMKRLREKLHQPFCLKTVRSIGYRMEDEE